MKVGLGEPNGRDESIEAGGTCGREGRHGHSGAGLDHLQHLGTNTASPALAIERLKNQTGRGGHISLRGGLLGLGIEAAGLIQQLLAG